MMSVGSPNLDNFTQVPNRVLRDGTLSPVARLLWVIGLSYAPGWVFHREELRERLGVSIPTLLRAIQELREHGLVTGDFRRKDEPLAFLREPQNVKNFDEEGKESLRSEDHNVKNFDEKRQESLRSNVKKFYPKNIKEEYQKNTTLAALDPIEGSAQRADDDTTSEAAAPEASATVKDCLTIRPDRDATDPDEPSCQAKPDNSPLPELPDETPPAQDLIAGWLEFVGRWNQTGQLPYTALQPTGMITAGLLRLNHLYGRDGPDGLIARVEESVWLREHPHTLAWALREENLTRIMDGEFRRKFSESTRSGKTQQAQRVAKCSREQVDLQW